MTQSDLEALRAMKEAAGLKNLPTEFTFIMRQAIAGAGPRAYDWSDKPHRLVYDLCAALEAVASIPKPPISGVERSAVLDLLNPLHGSLDKQLMDERSREEWNTPPDCEHHVIITEKMERDLTKAVLILEGKVAASPAPVEAGGSVVEASETEINLANYDAALRNIAGGYFAGASTLAVNGEWKSAYEQLQNIAKAALSAIPPATEGTKP